MNRRSFFRALLGGAVAAHELDIEKLLWVPGEKTIFVPPSTPIDYITATQIETQWGAAMRMLTAKLLEIDEVLLEEVWIPGKLLRSQPAYLNRPSNFL